MTFQTQSLGTFRRESDTPFLPFVRNMNGFAHESARLCHPQPVPLARSADHVLLHSDSSGAGLGSRLLVPELSRKRKPKRFVTKVRDSAERTQSIGCPLQ